MKKLISITISVVIALSSLCALPLTVHADSGMGDMAQEDCCYEKHEKVDEVRAVITSIELKTLEAVIPKPLELSINHNRKHQNRFKETASNSPPKNLLTGTTIKLE